VPLVEPPQIFGFPVACRGHGLRQSGEDGAGEPQVIFLPVTVHGGANTSKSGGYWHIPKRDLVHAGIVAEEELKNYRIKQNLATGYAGFEPLREGQHDDLLFATCLGVWAWERAIEKQDYISYPGVWELEGVPVNVVGKWGSRL
jgi:hypothetical protein